MTRIDPVAKIHNQAIAIQRKSRGVQVASSAF
jgi:hypothetical protein